MNRQTATLLAVTLMLATGCSTAPRSTKGRATLEQDARATLERFAQTHPIVHQLYASQSAGIAVFPTVGKAGVGLGGAYGKGVVFEDGRVVGYCDLTQASIGLQLGGQAYSEVIFFEGPADLADFKAGNVELSAQASAVALTADASTSTDYDNGVAVFTLAGRGLMYEASIGGQKFSYIDASSLVPGESPVFESPGKINATDAVPKALLHR